MKQTPRYLIAISLPPDLESTLRNEYMQIFGVPCPVRTLHTTLIPPFTVEDDKTLKKITDAVQDLPEFLSTFHTGKPGIFTAIKSRKILYLPLLPIEPLEKTFTQLMNRVAPYLSINTQIFHNNKLPAFLPHITLNYNFKDIPEKFTSTIPSFTLKKPRLLVEKGPGIWKTFS